MEMYADEEARGGVLEPAGIVSIKYRREKQLETMARLDPTYGELKRQLADKSLSQDELSDVKIKMNEREQNLLPVYSQIALQFADLHDRAGRMEAKGTIRHALQWRNARRFFYWRLRRRLTEELILKRMAAAVPKKTPKSIAAAREQNLGLLKTWSGMLDVDFDKDDRKVATWYEDHRKFVHGKIDGLKSEGVAHEVAQLLMSNKEGGLKGVQQVLSMIPIEEREVVIKYLTST